jgi:uncharacterized protein YraI
MKKISALLALVFILTACAPASTPTSPPAPVTETFIPASATASPTLAPPTETFTPLPPTETSTPTPIPIVDEIKATVTADKLVCRYGPGANYLYLIALNKGTPLTLIGRADGNDWVLVENEPQRCWVNSQFVEAEGDLKSLRSMYPDGYKIPVSPYYGPTTVLSAERDGDKIIVSWIEIIVSPGKYENEAMFPYIVEVWRCENGGIIFETLGSRLPFTSFIDESGCNEPSRGRVYIQEKHGYAGPADIPWPER